MAGKKQEVQVAVEAPEVESLLVEGGQADISEWGEAGESELIYQEEATMYDEAGNLLEFPNGPTADLVAEWRSRYNEVYLTEFESGEMLVWRPLNRQEYKDAMKIPNADNYYKEEKIFSTVLLWPENYGFQKVRTGKAGIPTLIFELVMEKSGFTAKTGAYRL
jgi:hypothetical protein